MSRTIFIGDIHGCAESFQRLLDRLQIQCGSDRILLTGDAFTRGPAPQEVFRLIRDLGAEMVLGNHEDSLMKWLPAHVDGHGSDALSQERRAFLEAMGDEADALSAWMAALPLWIQNPAWLLVHAGVHPITGLGGTTRTQCLTIRTWPPRDGIVGRRWHDHIVDRRKTIVFGHDAPRRLVLKRGQDGRPFAIGLDTGCVYGGLLTGYIFEEDRLVQVEGLSQ